MNILKALEQLDPAKDEHWTADGMPRVDVVAGLTGNEAVKRADITQAAPQFTRENLPNRENGDAKAHDRSEETETRPVDPPEVTGEDGGSKVGSEPNPHDLPPGPNAEQVKGLLDEQAALQEELITAQRAVEEAKRHEAEVNERANALNRRIDTLEKTDPNFGIRGIKAYLATQHQVRMEKAGRVSKFMDGMKPGEVREALITKSKLDTAMSGRKPPLGSGRPNFPRR